MTDEAQTQATHPQNQQPTRHARIMRGVVTPIFGLLAVAAIALGIINATLWKPNKNITARASVSGVRYVVTDPGVLPLLDEDSNVRAKVDGDANLCVALGSAKDVNGWISGSAYYRVTGMDSWNTLSVKKIEAAKAQDNTGGNVQFQNSDMWDDVKCNAGTVTISSKSATGDTVALIDLGSETNATVSMDWTREHVPDFAMPFFLAGGLFAVLAALSASVFAMSPEKRRKQVRATAVSDTETSTDGKAKKAGEVGIGAAIAGTAALVVSKISEFFSKIGLMNNDGRRRHASTGKRGASSRPVTVIESSTPDIVDPSARNLVADQEAEATDSTSVISQEELQDYFSRLASEAKDADESASTSESVATTSDTDEAKVDETNVDETNVDELLADYNAIDDVQPEESDDDAASYVAAYDEAAAAEQSDDESGDEEASDDTGEFAGIYTMESSSDDIMDGIEWPEGFSPVDESTEQAESTDESAEDVVDENTDGSETEFADEAVNEAADETADETVDEVVDAAEAEPEAESAAADETETFDDDAEPAVEPWEVPIDDEATAESETKSHEVTADDMESEVEQVASRLAAEQGDDERVEGSDQEVNE